ncbi:MAG: hypothetical protein NZ518_10280, partial [Dehalococcoidia bacterium]|nr:hypothetical protein [Dehalococcoidia bacterium]
FGDTLPMLVFRPIDRCAESPRRGAAATTLADSATAVDPNDDREAVIGLDRAASLAARVIGPLVKSFIPSGEPEPDPVDPIDDAPTPPARAASHRWRDAARALSTIPLGRPITVAIGLAIAVMLIGIGSATAMALGGDRGVGQTFQASFEDAQRANAQAAAEADPAAKRRLLREAEASLTRALAVRKDDPEAVQLLRSVRAVAAQIDRVVRVSTVTVASDLGQLGARNPFGLVIAEGNGFVLDESGWGVQRVALEANKPATPLPIATRGQATDNGSVGDPIAITYLGRSDPRPLVGLLVLDKDRNLFLQPSGRPLQQLAIRDAHRWGSAVAIKTYAGSLYVLDPKSNQIWRYLQTAAGFDSEAKGILDGANIRDARDFAIDGAVYVLTESGRIVRVSGGAVSEFDLKTLDKPFNQPIGIVTGVTAKFIYVADPNNG